MTKTVMAALTEMRASVESMISSETERIGSPSLGDVVRQGDLYLCCIDKLPEGVATKDMQLAPGNTQGSRHILSGDVSIVKPSKFGKLDTVLIGPAFTCKGDTTVTHPEHGHKVLPADTTWQVVYQQAYADVVRRVQD